ncbi:MAG TPA: hypothetical protein VFH39_03470 [Candidatus Saccharimonadales bacterium]|nr:hypothetical protein [Candidatus Saccharimonadales bacterium]
MASKAPPKKLTIRKKVAMTAAATSMLAVGTASMGVASADSYWSNSNNYSNGYSSYNTYGSYGGYSSYNNYGNYWNNYRPTSMYSQYRWVYDPCLHRMVLIGYSTYYHRWQYCNSYDRYSMWSSPYRSYSYNNYWY